MTSHNFQPPQQPEYTLPGIIHYLQREKTTIDRDRIQWENERGELKARIGHLEGEKQSLEEKVKQLESQLKRTGGKDNKAAKSNDVVKYKFNNVDLNPLARSKEKLQSQLKEISYLLSHTSIDHTSHLELNKERAYLSSNSGLHQDVESTAGSSLKSQTSAQPLQANTPNFQIDSPGDSSSKSLSEQNGSPFVSEDSAKVTSPVTNGSFHNFSDETHSIESDTETITEEPEESSSTFFENNVKEHHKNWQKFILSSHVSTITAVSASENGDILGAAEDGTIKFWSFQSIAAGDAEVKPQFAFTGEIDPIYDIHWIDNDSFVTATPKTIRFWDKKQSTSGVKMSAESSSIDVKSDKLLIVANNTVSLNTIEKANNLRYKNVEQFKHIKADHARFSENGDIVTFHDNSCEIYNWATGASRSVVLQLNIKESDEITDFRIQGDVWVFIINKTRVLSYNHKSKKSLLDKTYNTSVVSVKHNKNHIVVILDNGEIQIYKSGATDQVFEDFNIYALYEDLSSVKPTELELFKGSVKSSVTLVNNYIIAGCEDGMIRGLQF